MPVNKNDAHARQHWPTLYDETPKSVFATVAWHLANIASGQLDGAGAAEARFAEELRALMAMGIIPPKQALKSHKLAVGHAEWQGYDPSDEHPGADE